MSSYVCSVCGYVYNPADGSPQSGIAAGTAWADLPHDWTCPLCGADNTAFEEQNSAAPPKAKHSSPKATAQDDMRELSLLEASALCTNLARGCEKQYKPKEEALFRELADYFKAGAAPIKSPSFDKLLELIDKDLNEGFPHANASAFDVKDRGALRALVWSEKVTRILKSLLSRYKKQGDAMLENTGVFVCTICGFIYIGDTLPDICPVCKVPNWKFEKVEGGAV